MQWLQNPNQSNFDNLNNARRKASRHIRNKKREYLKAKVNELQTNSKNKNVRELYRGISDFKKGYWPRTNIVKDEKGDLVAGCHGILARWRNYFSQLLNDVRLTEIHTAELLVPKPSVFEVEMAIEKLKRYKSPGIDQIPAELIKAGSRKFYSKIHKLINPVRNEKELPDQWKKSVILPVYKKGDKTDCSNYRSISLLSTAHKVISNILLSRLTPYAEKITGYHQCGFRRNRSTTDHIFCNHQILEKKWEYNGAMHQLFVDFKKAYNSVRREVLYNILIELSFCAESFVFQLEKWDGGHDWFDLAQDRER